jgi:colanic acid biosynthesis glycosyl transferase WcaI
MTARQGTLWVATEIYYPEKTSTGFLMTKLAEGLATSGNVGVLCAQPSYELRGASAPPRERVNNVEIVRVPHPRFNRARILGRALNVAAVTPRIFFEALRQFRAGDVAIVVTNPPLLPFAIYAAAKLRGVPVALVVHDVYPEAAILAGILKPRGLLASLWRTANNWLFRRMDRVVVLGRDALSLLAARMPDGDARLRIIGNWADTDEVLPAEVSENTLLNSLGLRDRFVLGYAGNMGRVHDIELLLAAANRLRDAAPDVHMLFVGNGAKDPQVKAAAERPGSNVTLVGPMDRDQQPMFLNACHVAVMALAPGMSGVGVPSRLYNVMAAGRPVVAAVDADSEPSLVLQEEAIGIQVTPGDADAFVGAVLKMRSDPSYLRQAGERARRAATKRFGFPITLEAYKSPLGEWNWPGPAA